jgi:hypothetical protein
VHCSSTERSAGGLGLDDAVSHDALPLALQNLAKAGELAFAGLLDSHGGWLCGGKSGAGRSCPPPATAPAHYARTRAGRATHTECSTPLCALDGNQKRVKLQYRTSHGVSQALQLRVEGEVFVAWRPAGLDARPRVLHSGTSRAQ